MVVVCECSGSRFRVRLRISRCVRCALIAYVSFFHHKRISHLARCGDFINHIILLSRRDSERPTARGPCVSVNDINPNEWNVPLAVRQRYGSLASPAVHLQLEYEITYGPRRHTYAHTERIPRVHQCIVAFLGRRWFPYGFFLLFSRLSLCRSLMLWVFVVSFPSWMWSFFFSVCRRCFVVVAVACNEWAHTTADQHCRMCIQWHTVVASETAVAFVIIIVAADVHV